MVGSEFGPALIDCLSSLPDSYEDAYARMLMPNADARMLMLMLNADADTRMLMLMLNFDTDAEC